MSTSVMTQYLQRITKRLEGFHDTNTTSIQLAARMVADQVKNDRIVYAYGPGGHSNLGSQEEEASPHLS